MFLMIPVLNRENIGTVTLNDLPEVKMQSQPRWPLKAKGFASGTPVLA